LRLSELAAQLECRLDGDGTLEITGAAGLEHAGPGQLTFFGNPKLKALLDATRASAVIVPDAAPAIPQAMLRSKHPYLTFARALTIFHPRLRPAAGVSPQAVIEDDVEIGADVSIGPFVVIGRGVKIGARTVIASHVSIGAETVIGDDCDIRPHASIGARITLGQRVIIYDGVVIGSDGFGFARQKDGTHLKIPQHAGVVIEDDVEIGANSTIDRPAIGETRIRAGTKIDNLVHIAHGVSIGRRALLAAQVGIAGSTIVEDDVMMAGQSGVTGHVRIGAGAIVGAKSAVLQSVDAGSFVTGHPAFDHTDWRKASVVFRQLPALKKRVEELELRLAELEEKLAACPPPVDR